MVTASELIPLSVPEIRGNEWLYLKQCLDENFVSSVGRFVERFEYDLARVLGVRHAVATVNGTAALHIALRVAGVEPDDEVFVSTLTFIAPANAIRYANAWPIFVDADPNYWQMDVDKLREFIRRRCSYAEGTLRNRATGRRIRAVVPVHILGHPVDMDPLLEIATNYNLAVVEDATESLGATYKGRAVGTVGQVGCFSFNGNKLITCGGGGMVVTSDADFASRTRYLTTQAKDDPIEFVHREIGYNYRLTNLQAAVGCAQLEQIEVYVEKKWQIRRGYERGLSGLAGITLMPEAPWAKSTFWLCTILVDEREFGMSSRALMRALDRRRIQTRPLWQPMHASPAHSNAPATDCGTADFIQARALSLPSSVGLTAAQQDDVVAAIREVQEESASTAGRKGVMR